MDDPILRLSPPSLANLFDFEIKTSPSEFSYCKNLLHSLQFDRYLERIRSLSNTVEFKYTPPEERKPVEPGSIFVLHVEVVCERQKLKIIEKGKGNSDWLFKSNLDDSVRVIWIHSISIRTIDAKLQVYKEYKNFIRKYDIVLHHVFEDIDSICKASGNRIFAKLSRDITLVERNVPLFTQELESIVQRTFDKILSRRNIRNVCYNVYIRGVGAGFSSEHNSRSASYVKEIKEQLVNETFSELINSLGREITEDISRYIESYLNKALNVEFFRLKAGLSHEMFGTIHRHVENILEFFFDEIRKIFVAVWTYVSTFFWSVDVNSEAWREKVADEIYEEVCKKEKSIFKNISDLIRQVCAETKGDLANVLEQIREMNVKLSLPNQQELVHEWKNREVVEDIVELRKQFPCICTYIAGRKNSAHCVKVFLNGDNRKAKSFFRKKSKIARIDFVDVSTELHARSEKLKKRREQSKKVTIMDNHTRNGLRKIQKRYEDKLMANHSNIIGIGVGHMMSDGNQDQPCIVLYCLDKSLIPFGEQDLPKSLDGYPVDIREDLIMFGHCTDCRSLHNGCSIGRPFADSAGSVGFFVKSRKATTHQTFGFLTAAHVALENDFLGNLYEKRVLLSKNTSESYIPVHEIIHPSWKDSKNNDKIGTVAEAFCGNFGPNEKGVDAAFVIFNKPTLKGKSEVQMVEDRDLQPGESLVVKTGRTTGHTTGMLDERFTVSFPNPYNPALIVSFKDCHFVDELETPFFEGGDSGSGVFLIDKLGLPSKALGIAFAFSHDFQKTVVCDIRDVTEAFQVTVYRELNPIPDNQEQEPMEI